MSWRRAGPADRPQIEDRLGAVPECAMFPLANLASHGMEGGHDRAMSFWLSDGGILGLSDEGIAMATAEIVPDLAALLAAIGPAHVKGALGPTGGTRAFLAAAGLAGAPATMDDDEPQFVLALADLRMPDVAGLSLMSVRDADPDLLAGWRLAFGIEVMGWDAGHADRARADVARHVAADSHRVLMCAGRPVAATGFNARLPGIVQVGGVYVPPEMRRRGLARAAVALHLAEAHSEGAARATLCAASDHAARAYASLGFERIGAFTMTMFGRHLEIVP